MKFLNIEKKFDDYLLLEDRGVVRVVIASTIANQMEGNDSPTWLMLVSASSSGKSEILDSLLDLKADAAGTIDLIYPISDLTTNSFASAYNSGAGQTGSLLDLMPNKGAIMVFKDFTTLLSKGKDAQHAIMSQLREIYDGSYVKRTGTVDIKWTGRLGAIAGVTEFIYESDEKMSAMGSRWVMYDVKQPNRMDVARRKLDNRYASVTETQKKLEIRGAVCEYITAAKEFMLMEDDAVFRLNKEQEENLMRVANLSTIARSGVLKNFQENKIIFVPSPEMPMRMLDQLISIGKAMVLMNQMDGIKNGLSELDMTILYDIALASIPKKRRMAMQVLTKFKLGVSTKGVSDYTHYPTQTVRMWLEELTALNLVKRVQTVDHMKWILREEWRDVMAKFEGIIVEDKEYVPADDEDEEFNAFAETFSDQGTDWSEEDDDFIQALDSIND